MGSRPEPAPRLADTSTAPQKRNRTGNRSVSQRFKRRSTERRSDRSARHSGSHPRVSRTSSPSSPLSHSVCIRPAALQTDRPLSLCSAVRWTSSDLLVAQRLPCVCERVLCVGDGVGCRRSRAEQSRGEQERKMPKTTVSRPQQQSERCRGEERGREGRVCRDRCVPLAPTRGETHVDVQLCL